MKPFVAGSIAVLGLMAMPGMTMAQSKTVTSEMKVETGTVQAIDLATRAVTLKKADGRFVTTVAGPDIKRFAEVKVGEQITGRYYENIVVRVKQPGEPDVVTATKGTTGSAQDLPGGTRARQLTITATIAGIDTNTPSITFTGPNGWKYTSRIQDTEALAKMKVGDRVDIVWTEAILVSLDRDQ
jgi:hypothetical protein